MRLLAKVTVAKEAGNPASNEDYAAWRAAHDTWALSDGASESFAARRWARIIALSFVAAPFLATPVLEEKFVATASKRYSQMFDPQAMSWSAAAAYERGSFTTLLGLVWFGGFKAAKLVGIGDSVAILFDGTRIVASFPYEHPDQFMHRPLLISSRLD